MSEFTLTNYGRLLDAFSALGLRPYTVVEYLQKAPQHDFIILRHDVEWGTKRALEMAQLESERGLTATYYFHGPHRTKVFVPGAMKQIEDMGHEVGYHYETLDLCNGNYERAEALFADQLRTFRSAGLTIDTVCQHGNPRKKKVGYRENGDLFREDLARLKRTYELIGEAYYSIDFDHVTYLSDVGIRFANMGESCPEATRRIRQSEHRNYYLLAHPDYWSRGVVRALGLYWAGRALRSLRLNRLVAAARAMVSRRTKP